MYNKTLENRVDKDIPIQSFCLKQNLQSASPDTACREISFRKDQLPLLSPLDIDEGMWPAVLSQNGKRSWVLAVFLTIGSLPSLR